METIISQENTLVTLVNVFTVVPEQQQELVDLLIEATDQVMRHLSGFISANIHKSLDGTKVVNNAQWESQEAFAAMLHNEEAIPHMAKAARIAQSVEPHLYEVAYVDHK